MEAHEMDFVRARIQRLTDRNNVLACGAMKELEALSTRSNEVCPHLPALFALLESDNSYQRNRALTLIAANARWDTEGVIDRRLDAYLQCIQDEKPITARQCIAGLSKIALQKPALAGRIIQALTQADPGVYSESMRPLVEKDILSALKRMASASDGA